MIAALRHGQFRNLWFGMCFNTVGFWMQTFAQGWLVVELAIREGAPERAPFYLGIVAIGRAGPGLVLTMYSGALADRIERRQILLWANAASGLVALALGIVTVTGFISVALLAVLSVLTAMTQVFDGPTRNSMIGRMVPRADLMGAVSVLSATVQGGAIIGPLLGGLLILPLGPGGIFLLKALAHVAYQVALFSLQRQVPEGPRSTQGAFAAILDGLRYVRDEPILRMVVAGLLLGAVTIRPVISLLPSVTANVLHVGAVELSWLLAGASVGSVLGAVAGSLFGRFQRQGRLLAGSWFVTALFVAIFAVQGSFWLAMAFLVLQSFTLNLARCISTTLLQTRTPDHLRGRVLSLDNLNFNGFMPIGTMVWGAVATVTGIDLALAAAGLIGAILFALGFVLSSELRRLGTDTKQAIAIQE